MASCRRALAFTSVLVLTILKLVSLHENTAKIFLEKKLENHGSRLVSWKTHAHHRKPSKSNDEWLKRHQHQHSREKVTVPPDGWWWCLFVNSLVCKNSTQQNGRFDVINLLLLHTQRAGWRCLQTRATRCSSNEAAKFLIYGRWVCWGNLPAFSLDFLWFYCAGEIRLHTLI